MADRDPGSAREAIIALLSDPQPGLFTWRDMVVDAMRDYGFVPDSKAAEEPKESIESRFARFEAAVAPGVIFVNEYGRRCEILSRYEAHYRNIPEDGPLYNIRCLWADAETTDMVNGWWTIGEPENVTT